MLAIAAGALLFTLNRLDEGAVLPDAVANVAPRYTLIDTDWTRFDDDGQPSMTGAAETMVYFSDQSGQATNIVVNALDINGGPWKLAAPNALLPATEKRIELLGNVDIAGQWPDSGDALRARTDKVWVDPDKHQINTEEPVEVDSSRRSGTAVGLDANWENRSLQLLHDVKMIYKAPPQ